MTTFNSYNFLISIEIFLILKIVDFSDWYFVQKHANNATIALENVSEISLRSPIGLYARDF